MIIFTKLLIRAAGYSPARVAGEHPDDIQTLAKLGGGVLFSSMVAFCTWTFAAFYYADSPNFTNLERLSLALLAGAAGFVVCMVLDSSFIWFSDTAPIRQKTWRTFSFPLIRMILIFSIGSATSQAVMVKLLENDSGAHGLQMREKSDTTRRETLSAQLNLPKQESEILEAKTEVVQRATDARTLPVDIVNKLSNASRCWNEYAAAKANLVQSGLTDSEARSKLTAKSRDCGERARAASNLRDTYFTNARKALEEAQKSLTVLTSNLGSAKNDMSSKIAAAAAIENASFNAYSTKVMWSLMLENPGILLKWAIVTLIILIGELIGVLYKLQVGRTVIGLKISTETTVRRSACDLKFTQSEHDHDLTRVLYQTAQDAREAALSSKFVQQHFSRVFEAYVAGLAPAEAVRAMMRDLAERQSELEDFKRRYPQFATVVSDAWANAVSETSKILAGNGAFAHKTI